MRDFLYGAAYAKAMASRPRGGVLGATRPALAADPATLVGQWYKTSGSRIVPQAMRADAMLEKGDLDGYAVWRRSCGRAAPRHHPNG